MSRKISVVTAIILFFIPVLVFAQGLRVNNKETQEGQTINIFYEELDAGKINFSIPVGNNKKAEITFDNGRNWEEMEKGKDYFTFAHRPPADEVIMPEFLFTSEDGKMSTERPGVRINYQRKSPDQAVEQVLEKMKTYYEQESIARFMSLISSSFPDRVKFEQSIENDFYNYNNIRLHYTIERKVFDDDLEGAIWDVYWERKYEDRAGASFSDSATVGMRFAKEGSNWMITGLRNNTIFGSSLLAMCDLSISSADMTLVPGLPYKVYAVVRNLGTAPASSIRVDFSYAPTTAGPWNFETSEIITGPLNPGSSITVIHNTAVINPVAFKVDIDPLGAIQESSRSNNSATKFFP